MDVEKSKIKELSMDVFIKPKADVDQDVTKNPYKKDDLPF